ncbi:Transposon Ty3-I Gag-Pol polyprotein [Porphyridium purpureum]|uniref:RNA-directed DNA polymerase n=1 Tax=Porphyridium purpureum TaxID=35688 RepID=A0A5J4Z0J4_PORPP|nr:Transposon Ty3-I Gag-Pol polyprotein [Porphyridium purpureum]|eukprot:POR5651..scf208_2
MSIEAVPSLSKCDTPADPSDLLPVSWEYGTVKIFDKAVLCSVRGSIDRRPFVAIRVLDSSGLWLPIIALVDTGATGYSYTSRTVAERWGATMEPTGTRVDHAQGGNMGPAWETLVEVRLGQLRTKLRCIVVEELAEDLIIGMEFWHRHSHSLNFKNRIVEMRNGEHIPCFTNKTKERSFIRSVTDTKIPGLGQCEILIELPEGVVDTHQRTWTIQNKSKEPVCIRAGQKLASIRVTESQMGRETLDLINALDLGHILDSGTREKIRGVLKKRWRVFRAEAGRARSVEHVIRVEPGATFPAAKLRRRSEAEREAEETMVRKLLDHHVLEPCNGPFASANVLIRKPTGAWRLTTDFRNLNAITVKDKYPIPLVHECLDWAGRYSLFSTLDLTDGFFQIPLHADSRDLTAMITPLGLFRYCVIGQGMSNSPATFQRLMNTVLGDLRWKHALIYIDDLIVGSSSGEDHIQILDQILERFEKEGLTFSLKKCSFMCTKIEFLGHQVQNGKIRPKERNIEVIRQWTEPRNPTEVQRFLGVVGWFRDFVPNFERVAAPLRASLEGLAMSAKKHSKKQVVECSDWANRFGAGQKLAFEALKSALTDPTVVLYQPSAGAEWVLDTDASLTGLGAALYQRVSSEYRPVCFLSRSLTAAEKNYAVTELECLAVVWAVRKCRHYLYGESIIVRSDHEPLRWLLNLREPRGRLARWALALADYSFVIEYVKGASNKVPDALSRMNLDEQESRSSRGDRVAYLVTAVSEDSNTAHELPTDEELKAAYPRDELIAKEMENLARSTPQYSDPEYFWNEAGILMAATKKPRRVVPDAFVSRVLGYYHSTGAGGHMGAAKTISRIADASWYWPGWTSDVSEFIQSCRFCSRRKGLRRQQVVIGRRRPTRRFELVAVDLLTISPKTPRGYTKVLVVADLFTRFTVAAPVVDESARSAVEAFLHVWVAPFGPPENLLSDNGPAFRSEFLSRVSQLLGIKKVFTMAHNPKANGVVERYNRTLCGLLSGMMADHDASIGWDLWLPLSVHAYNSSRHSSTGVSPYEAMFGRTANDYSQPAIDAELETDSLEEFGYQLRGRIRMMHQVALRASDKSHDKDARRSAEKVTKQGQRLSEGDAVMLWRGVSTLQGRKLESPWVGPYILEVIDGARATIRNAFETFFVHLDRLKRVDQSVELRDDFNADGERRDSVLSEIASLQKQRLIDGSTEFLVAWYGAKRSEWTWEKSEDLPETLVAEFLESAQNPADVLRSRSGLENKSNSRERQFSHRAGRRRGAETSVRALPSMSRWRLHRFVSPTSTQTQRKSARIEFASTMKLSTTKEGAFRVLLEFTGRPG